MNVLSVVIRMVLIKVFHLEALRQEGWLSVINVIKFIDMSDWPNSTKINKNTNEQR